MENNFKEVFDLMDNIKKTQIEITYCEINLKHLGNELTNLNNILKQVLVQSPYDVQKYYVEVKKMLTEKKENLKVFISSTQNYLNLIYNDHLKYFEWLQGLIGNDDKLFQILNVIQKCIEDLYDISNLLLTLCQLTKSIAGRILLDKSEISEFDNILAIVQSIKKGIILRSLIVEAQPIQVIKTKTRFEVALRCLIGSKLKINQKHSKVKCMILSETEAKPFCNAYYQMDEPPSNSPGQISSNEVSFEIITDSNSSRLVANLKQMQLTMFNRPEKNGAAIVTDEKFLLLFYTSLSSDADEKFLVWTLSLPIVVVVHNNQAGSSWATITWDSIFWDTKNHFEVPKCAKWKDLFRALNFRFAVWTGRTLTEENLAFLYEKLSSNNNSSYITWHQFCKETLKDRSFTFWEWFYEIMKLIKDNLQKLWAAGYIHGFIDRSHTISLLNSCPEGTFLIRFSDSAKGGVTLAVRTYQKVMFLEPYMSKDLNYESLADRIKSSELKYLCTGCSYLEKNVALENFYSPPKKNNSGYVFPNPGSIIGILSLDFPLPDLTIAESDFNN